GPGVEGSCPRAPPHGRHAAVPRVGTGGGDLGVVGSRQRNAPHTCGAFLCRALDTIRTCDFFLRREALYPLSYEGEALRLSVADRRPTHETSPARLQRREHGGDDRLGVP